jgi:hypothetical protein
MESGSDGMEAMEWKRKYHDLYLPVSCKILCNMKMASGIYFRLMA